MGKLFTIIFILFSVFSADLVQAQAKQDKYMDEEFEGGILKPNNFPDIPAPRPPLLKILKYDNKDLMTGNACVQEETTKMGFEYLVLCNKDLPTTNRLWVLIYNFGTNLELTFKNGPGWKLRLKKRIVECRKHSADFVW